MASSSGKLYPRQLHTNIGCFCSNIAVPAKQKSEDYGRVADTVGACGAHFAEHYLVTVGVDKQ
jgi:hypothetical protein